MCGKLITASHFFIFISMSDDTTTPTTPIPSEPEDHEEMHAHIEQEAAAGAIDERDARIADLESTLTATDANWKRAVADLANYRRQADEEKRAFATFAAEKTMLAILPVFDNFERLTTHLPDEFKTSDTGKSFDAVKIQFGQALAASGLAKIELAIGDAPDPAACQAIGVGAGAANTVIEIFEHGYRLGGKVIRTAKVRVGDGSSVGESVH